MVLAVCIHDRENRRTVDSIRCRVWRCRLHRIVVVGPFLERGTKDGERLSQKEDDCESCMRKVISGKDHIVKCIYWRSLSLVG